MREIPAKIQRVRLEAIIPLPTEEELPRDDNEVFPQVALATAQIGLEDPRIVPSNPHVVVTDGVDSGDEGEENDQSLDDGGDDDEVIIQPHEGRQ